MSTLHHSKAGSQMAVVMEISHVTYTASEINQFSRPPGTLEVHVLDLVPLQHGIDVVMVLHLVAAIALCTVNMVEMHVTMTAAATDALSEAGGMDIVNAARIAIVGAQVPVVQAMNWARPVQNSWNMTQACAQA